MSHCNVGIKTLYKFFSVNPETGKRTALTDWCGNTILTSGRNQLSSRDWFTAIQVGTDSTLPNATQTALLAYTAGSNTITETDYGCTTEAPYYAWKRKTFRFTSGIENENLNEVGIGWSPTTATSLMARCLIVDINGDPVTVTPLPGEWMDVLTEVRYYPPTVDVTGTIDIYGETYDYIVRASDVTDTLLWAQFIGNQIEAYATNNSDWYVTDDDIGTILTGPSGILTSADNNSEWDGAYVENSYQHTFGLTVGANGWNSTTGKLLRSMRIRTTAGAYQIQFDRQSSPGLGIPKTNLLTLGTGFTIAWDEAVI